MGVYAVYIQKETPYQGGVRSFGNTYHFKTNVGQLFLDQSVAEAVAAAEKLVTLDEVTFKAWRTWGPTDGTTFNNVMREAGDLSGNGAIASTILPYREVCSLVVWPMPRSPVTNRRRWLRKFLRQAPGASPSALVAAGEGALSSSYKDPLLAYANSVNPVTIGGVDSFPLCTEDGTEANGSPAVRDYLYTRQIGQ